MKTFGLKNTTVALLGVGLVTMAVDAGIAHFAAGTMKHAGQIIPVAFGLVAVTLVCVLFKERWLTRLARWVGGTAMAVGALGTAYHVAALLRVLTASGSMDSSLLGMALTIAPPLLAPGAFIGLGAALWVLASPRVGITLAGRRSGLAHA